MAEIFGAASAAIGVAAAAGQLINGIMELRSFCSQVRRIPDDVQAAVDDLSTMAEVLEFIKVEMSHDTLPYGLLTHPSFVRVTANLQQSSQQVREILKEMQAKLGTKNPLGRIKAVGMKNRLQMATKQVESAQRMVLILLPVENRMTIRHSFVCQENRLAMISAGTPPISQNNMVAKISPEDRITNKDKENSAKNPQKPNAIVSAEQRSFHRSLKAKGRPTSTWTLPLPRLLTKSLWEFSVYKATQGWNFHLRAYALCPENAPIFKAILNGDLRQVDDLLSSGAASMWDRDHTGMGLLHIAALSCRSYGPSIIEYLLKNGADIYAVDDFGFPPYFWFRNDEHAYMEDEKERHLAGGYKAFTSHRDWIPCLPSTSVPLTNSQFTAQTMDFFPIFNNPPEEVIQSVLSEMQPPWKDMSPTDRINMLIPEISGEQISGFVNPVCIRACLGRDLIRENFANLDTKDQARLSYEFVTALAQQSAMRNEKGMNEARLFLKDIWTASNNNIQALAEMDPLRLFVDNHTYHLSWKKSDIEMHRSLVDAVQIGLKQYVSELMLLGMNMAMIIEIEKILLARQAFRGYSERIIWCRDIPYRTIRVDSGPRIEDWYFWVSNPLDEWAEDFWDMIEHPERTIPGTWMED